MIIYCSHFKAPDELELRRCGADTLQSLSLSHPVARLIMQGAGEILTGRGIDY